MRKSFHLPSLLALAALGALVPATLDAAQPRDERAAAESRLRAAAGGTIDISYHRATGTARFVRLPAGSTADLAAGIQGELDARAHGFLTANAAIFGIRDARTEIDFAGERRDRQGYTHQTFLQFHRGVPVYGGMLRVHFDAAGRLHAANGLFVPALDLDVAPRVSAESARVTATTYVGSSVAPGSRKHSAAAPTLVVYNLGLDRGVGSTPHLAWRVEVADGGQVREEVFVDARTGKVLDHLTGIHDALNRRAFDGFDGDADNIPDDWPATPAWVEGNPLPSASQELDNMVISTFDVYSVFNALGQDSYDDAGHVMDAAYERNYGCPNASWNGLFISFCPGFTTHDVTAHEWGHAYTQFTHGLIYRWQSGALNEAYSDIWGEAMDLKRNLSGMVDTDTPNGARTLDSCSAFQVGLPRQILVNSPGPIAATYISGTPAYGPNVLTNAPTADLVLAVDGTGVDSNDACEPLTGPATGLIVFANRGNCNVSVKTENAQAAGALGLVMGNVAASPSPTIPASPGCGSLPDCSGITIPTVTLNLADGDTFRANIAVPINATFQPAGVTLDNSLRWLMGEDVAGGALRDMWTPGCFGDPGSVTDPNYFCGTADNGGVHFNSGIPNHAFALLVDGGTFNGHTVAPIGFAKAAHIYFRAQNVYQVPYSDFSDHADALEASCVDLTGPSLADPWGGAAVTIAPADCDAVEEAMLAVEMRDDNLCGFGPVLDPNAPALCAAGFDYSVRLDTFESSNGGWAASRRDVTNPGTFDPRDWDRVSGLPDGQAGTAFYAEDPTSGDCVVDDETGVLVLQSPTLVMPHAGITPRLAFDHYIASELGYDGGNVKISVNAGPFAVVPGTAFSFNPYVGLLEDNSTNTNPMASEEAFHGANEGSNAGSWGRSILDLSGLVTAGQTFQLRYEFGTDGCGGTTLGWYVDDVNLFACTADEALFIDGVEDGNSGRWSSTQN